MSLAVLKTQSDINRVEKPSDSQRPQQVILLVHGIRTYAEWQPMVKRVLEEIPGTLVVPLKYEWLDAFRFWLPFLRTRELENIHRRIRDAFAEYRDVPISIIAHSFGTHAIGELLKNDPQFRIQRLVLCGSIFPRSFRWDLYRSKVESEVINDRGSKDIWPVLARSSSWGYGDSGTHGFGAVKVQDRAHNFKHSDYFEETFVRDFWLPWFQSGKFIGSKWDEKEPPGSWWRVVISLLPLKWVLVILLLSPVVWGIYAAKSRSPVSNHTIGQSSGSMVIREDRPDPPEDIPSMDPDLNPLTGDDRERADFRDTSISIFNNSNKTVRLAYTNIPQPDGKERSVYGHRESSELSPGQTIKDHEVSFGGPYHISVYADGAWTKTDRWYDLGIVAERQIVIDNASGAFRCTIHFLTEEQ